MKKITFPSLLLFIFSLTSCTKDGDLNGNLGDLLTSNMTTKYFRINIHKTGNYPDSASIQIFSYSYPLTDSSNINSNTSFTTLFSLSDTTFSESVVAVKTQDQKRYYIWKVIGPDQDSLSGGRTSTQSILYDESINTYTYEINY